MRSRAFGLVTALCLPTLTSSQAPGDTITAGVQVLPPPSAHGDSMSLRVGFAATGGSVTSAGTFTAGANAGTFRIVANSGAIADTATVTVTAAPADLSPKNAAVLADPGDRSGGIPFGPFAGWDGSTPKPNTDNFTLVMGPVEARSIIGRIGAARSRGWKVLLAMTGGAHSKYMTDGVFDVTKWEAKMNTYNTPVIKAAVAEAVTDGTLIGNILMDEPANTSENNTWGPAGTMTKERVDAMAVYAKAMFPTLPMGVTLDYRIWNDRPFRVIDFQVSQYRQAKGNVAAYRDGALALGARDGHAILFSMNVLDGGKREADCPIPETGGAGTYRPNCRMTPEQVREYGRVLGPAGCALLMWRYDPAFMARSENQEAFRDVAEMLEATPGKPCKRG